MKKLNSKQRTAVEELLQRFGENIKSTAPTTKDGQLDVKALNEMPETKAMIESLKTLGVKNRQHLSHEGFVVGGMLLNF